MKSTTTNNRNSFVLYQDNAEILESLTDEQRGKLFSAIFDYQKDFKLPEDAFIRLALSPFIAQFKRDSQKWERTCEEKTIAGKMGNLKRWHPELYKKVIDGAISLGDAMLGLQPQEPSQPNPTQSDPIGEIANIAVNVSDNVSVSISDIINIIEPAKKSKSKPRGFVPPSLQEVQDYCKSRGNSVNPKGFLDYYVAGDWKDKDGKAVKNWKQKVLSWENRNSNDKPTTQDLLANNLNQIAGGNYFQSVTLGDVVKITCVAGMKTKAYSLPTETKDKIKAQFKQPIEIK
jgi:hypothetical protein